MRFRQGLLVWLTPVLVLSLVLVGASGIWMLRTILLESIRQEGHGRMDQLQWAMTQSQWVSAVNEGDLVQDLEENLSQVLLPGEGLMVQSFGQDGQVHTLLRVGQGVYGRLGRQGALGQTGQEGPVRVNGSQFLRIEGVYSLLQVRQVHVDGQAAQLIWVKDVQGFDDQFGQYALVIGLVTLAVAGGSWALLYGLSKRLVRPLALVSEGIGHLDFSSHSLVVPPGASLEVASLTGSVNRLVEKLEVQHQAMVRERDLRQDFVDMLRHEMRTPLTSIVGYGDLLRRDIPTAEERAGIAQTIYDEGKRLENLSEVLSVGLLAKGALDLTEVSWKTLQDQMEQIHRLALEDKELGLVFEGQGDYLLDHALFIQALSNVVDNAIKATPSGGQIGLIFKEASISVWDTGQGYGIGLHIAREVCQAHGGNLQIGSRGLEGDKGMGTLVTFHFDKSLTKRQQSLDIQALE